MLNRKRVNKNEGGLRDLWDHIKHTNIHIIGILKEKREKGAKNIFEDIIAETSPILERKQSSKSRKQSQTGLTHKETHQYTM